MPGLWRWLSNPRLYVQHQTWWSGLCFSSVCVQRKTINTHNWVWTLKWFSFSLCVTPQRSNSDLWPHKEQSWILNQGGFWGQLTQGNPLTCRERGGSESWPQGSYSFFIFIDKLIDPLVTTLLNLKCRPPVSRFETVDVNVSALVSVLKLNSFFRVSQK